MSSGRPRQEASISSGSAGHSKYRTAYFGNYKMGRRLGRGNFAEVKLATHEIAKTKVAVKIVNKKRIDEDNLRKIYREIQILKLLRHPHIVKLYEIMESESMLYICTEYAGGGEMFKLLTDHGRLGEREARRLFRQTVSAVAYCHASGVVHRDLKAENLLLDKDGNIKLIDFGFSNFNLPGELLLTWCGSPPYAAPELFLGQDYNGTKADIWSLGVVLYILVCGGFPFPGNSLDKLKNAVLSGQVNIPFDVSVACTDLIRKMLVVKPEKRLNIEQVIQHRWFVVRDDFWTSELERLLEASCNPKAHLRLDDLANRPPNNTVLLYMQQKGGWPADKVTEAVTEKRFDAVYGTYHILCDKLIQQGGSLESSLEVAGYPVIGRDTDSRRGSRGSITTGLVNIDPDPATMISASDLAKLNLSSPDEDSSSPSEGSGTEESSDRRHQGRDKRQRRRMMGGPTGAGLSKEDRESLKHYLAVDARRHTLGHSNPGALLGMSAMPFLVPQMGVPVHGFPMVPAMPFPLCQGLPYVPGITPPNVGIYPSNNPAGFFLTPDWYQQDRNFSADWSRRASDGGFQYGPMAWPSSNASLKSTSYAQVSPEGPLESSGGSEPNAEEKISVDEAGAYYLKVRGSRKRHTIHSGVTPLTRQYSPFLPTTGLQQSVPGVSGISPTNTRGHFGGREPYARASGPMRRASENSQLNTQALGHLERLYSQTVGLQQLNQEFQMLRATSEVPVQNQPAVAPTSVPASQPKEWLNPRGTSPPSMAQPLGIIAETEGDSPDPVSNPLPPEIAVTDERGTLLHHSMPCLPAGAVPTQQVLQSYHQAAQQILSGQTGLDNRDYYYASRPNQASMDTEDFDTFAAARNDSSGQVVNSGYGGKKSKSVLSSRAISSILSELRRVLDIMKVPYKEDDSGAADSGNSSRRVSLESDDGTKVEIGIFPAQSQSRAEDSEVKCQLDFKCLEGDFHNYNRICAELISGLHL